MHVNQHVSITAWYAVIDVVKDHIQTVHKTHYSVRKCYIQWKGADC